MTIELQVGQWSDGRPIDITRVPGEYAMKNISGATLLMAFDAENGGSFDAEYTFTERRSDGVYVYGLHRVTETMPPRPPQIRGYGDDVRLPMMEGGAFSPTLEAEQRRREWREAIVA